MRLNLNMNEFNSSLPATFGKRFTKVAGPDEDQEDFVVWPGQPGWEEAEYEEVFIPFDRPRDKPIPESAITRFRP